ncbi:cytochrome P450 [Loktanella ponticola]|uniref:Cytochrome P450 n=1 Tax=Yoonia ponticola TaxID=1524255 RepID=A0A7W9BL78_9RHOB|nr:cytochrome P450 [Yoonia ponticola]MBB5722568.1 cytochrome P450 [Yoonia ponticola]
MTRAPGPKGSLFWGSLADFTSDALGLLWQATRDHGDVVRLRFGPITAHLVNHPDHITHVLSRHADRYDKNTRSVERIRATCGDSLLSANADAWARHRRLIQPIFQPKMFTDISAIVSDEMGPMLDRWRTADKIDVASEMMHLVIAISARILFSSSVDAARVEAALAVILEDTWRRLQAPLDPSMISPAFHKRAFKDAVQTIGDVIFELIATRRRQIDAPDDLLSRLLAAHEADGDAQLNDKELRDAAVTLLLGGHETTANALAWAFHAVAQSPDAGIETQDPAHIFAEAVRLYPSIWIVERRAIAADTIGGFDIPRGSSVLISPYLIHRHPDFWTDPDRFDPARHAVETDRHRHAYIPFGLGQHRCVGLHMARAIASEVIAHVYAQFRLHPTGQTPAVDPGITLRPTGPLWLCPVAK